MPESTPAPIWAPIWAPRAWLPGGWQAGVLLQPGADGRWARISAGVAQPPAGAKALSGPLLPGLVDAHSHAFQRAFAGLAERRESESDTFWSWRDRMYRVALRITPEQLQAIAAQLYLELLQGGYTQVCEFHYLQHQGDGRPYADPLTLGWALADAAAEAGPGLTLMPALYERAGFTQPTLREDQRRFATTADSVWAAARRIAASGRPLVNAGLVLHSLRAAAPASVHRLRNLADGFTGPIHIHVAEQTAEVDDCLAATGQRPIEWLARQGLLDARWQLVHATHTEPAEIDAVARSGAGVVICPSTEANLGDGLCDLPGWLAAGVPMTIGSDSHVGRDWREELRWLDYGQRLAQRRRNVAAAPASGQPATAQRLFSRVLDAGAAACGEPAWGLVPGARADALVADPQDPALLGIPGVRWLDAQVFSSPVRPWRDVMVAGRWVIEDHHHPQQDVIARRFEAAMAGLWQAD
ncbi:MAG: formimidoylglutamate deiminase [Burkholderiaceae bacterium]|nr:formimidoylglutamate deiminase [Burkholderiaceae bacterium]